MNKLIQSAKQFLNDEEGVTAIEYGLIAALIAVGIVISLQAVGGGLVAIFNSIAGSLTAAL